MGSIARRYAKALLEVGRPRGSIDALGEDLRKVAHALRESSELRNALQNPVFPLSQRKAALLTVGDRLGVSGPVRNFLGVAAERGRIGELDAIEREYARMADQTAGRVRAEVSSARPLSEEIVNRLKVALEHSTGRRVLLDRKVEPDLIGGLAVKLGWTVYDGSVRAHLAEMRERLERDS